MTEATTTTRQAIPADVRAEAGKRQQRAMRYQRDTINVEARTVELAFASDDPYDRWWGTEILDCTPTAVNLARLNNRHPLLLNHDPEDQIGVIERAWVDADRKCRAVVRFSRGELGQEVFQDVQDGIRELVSVGYSIDDMVLESRTEDQATYRVTAWTPYEVSIVSIPADATVGVGRSLAAEAPTAQRKDPPVSETTTAAPAATQQPDIRVIETNARQAERDRVNEITAMGRELQMADMAAAAVRDGTDAGEFRKAVLAELVKRGKLQPTTQAAEIGMSDKEKRQYSVVRLMHALLEPNDKEAQRLAGFEIECSVAARKLQPVEDGALHASHRHAGYRVPHDVMAAPVAGDATAAAAAVRMIAGRARRDLTVGAPTAAGNLVATELLASSFIELLRNRMVLAGLGATVLDGLVGNLAIPSQTAGASTYWVTEGNPVTESELTTGQVTLTPKTVGMFTDYSRKALLQATPSIEALVRADLASGLAVEIDRAGIAGSASGGQPRGIINTAGIGSVAGGAAGAAPTYAHMVALEEAVAIANADVGGMSFLTNAKMRAQLRLTQVFASTNGQPVWGADNSIMGYRTEVTNQVPSNLVKGGSGAVCSAIIFGNFSDLLMGMWSGLDLILDPYALATSGGRRIVALQDVDVAVRRAVSFAAMLDALRT